MRAVLLALCAMGGAGCQPQIEIVLIRDAALDNPPQFVKFQIGQQPNPRDVREFGPFDPTAIPDEQFAPVVPGTEFFIDVIGCNEADPAKCVEGSSFTARGCTPFMTLGKDETTTVEIVVKQAATGDAECPPQS